MVEPTSDLIEAFEEIFRRNYLYSAIFISLMKKKTTKNKRRQLFFSQTFFKIASSIVKLISRKWQFFSTISMRCNDYCFCLVCRCTARFSVKLFFRVLLRRKDLVCRTARNDWQRDLTYTPR